MSIYLGNTPIAVNSSSRNIGEIIQSTIPLTDAGLHLLDGALINGTGSYSAFVTYIAGLVSNYPDLFITETDWQQSITDYGVCGKFVYDSTNNTVRLPKITGFTEGTTDLTALGDLVEAGLPNITGSVRAFIGSQESIGAFRNSGEKTTIQGAGTGNIGFTFDASRSSSIYGNSTTVQPQSIKVLYYIVIANSVKTNIEVDIDEVMTDLNGKADIDLSNVNVSGTSLASGWSMPSSRYIDLTLGASGSTYTAPANGWFVIRKKASASGQYWYFGNESAGDLCYSISTHNNNQTVEAFIPTKSGDTIRASYNLGGSTTFFRFIYAEGEN